jgi:hypothetical protein
MDTPATFTVEPYGKRWAIKSGGEVLLIAARKADAEALAAKAAETLTPAQRPAEPRAFARGG